MNLRKVIHYAIGPIGGALLGLITIPLIAWFFTKEDIGKYAIYQVVLSLSVLVLGMGADQSFIRKYHEINDKTGLFKTVLTPCIPLLIIVLPLIMFFVDISEKIYLDSNENLTILTLLGVLLSLFNRYSSVILRMEDRGILFSLSQLIPKVLFVILTLLLLIGTEEVGLVTLLYFSVSSLLVNSLFLLFVNRAFLVGVVQSKVCWTQIFEHLKFGLPLMVGAIAYWALTAVDKVAIKFFSNFSELGLYSLAISFSSAAMIVQSVFSTIWAPAIYKAQSSYKPDAVIFKVQNYVLLLVIILFSFAGIFGEIITLLLPEGYEDVRWLFIATISFPLFYTLSETTVIGLGIAKKTNYIMLSSFLAFIINFTGNVALVPIWGSTGAAISSLISFALFLVFRTEFSSYIWNRIPRGKMYIYVLLLVITASYSSYYKREAPVHSELLWLIILASTFICFRSEYLRTFQFILDKLARR